MSPKTPEERLIEDAKIDASIREELCADAPDCTKCKSKQVQYLGYTYTVSVWKCRECKTKWELQLPEHLYKRK